MIFIWDAAKYFSFAQTQILRLGTDMPRKCGGFASGQTGSRRRTLAAGYDTAKKGLAVSDGDLERGEIIRAKNLAFIRLRSS